MAALPLNLKTKVKSLLTRQRERTGDEDIESPLPSTSHPIETSPQHQDDKIDEIIKSMDKEYFQNRDEVDTARYELTNLGEGADINIDQLMDRILVLKKQDSAIYRKIYDLVFANYTAYVQELENVTALEVALQDASRTCVNARRQLRMAKEGVSNGGLGLLAKHRKRKRLQILLQILKTFKTLQQAETTLKELLDDGDYPSATRICIQCQQAIETYKEFSCVRQLAVSLQDNQTTIENELEQALGQIPANFNDHRYQLVQDAYRILGKTQRVNDLLFIKFTTAIHDMAYNVVAKYVKPNTLDSSGVKIHYPNLCKLIEPDNFIECLVELCKVLWTIMHNYYQVRQWHIEYDQNVIDENDEVGGTSVVELTFHRNYIKQKLDNGLLRIWLDVQQKVRPYLEGCDMSQFQYDNFIRVLDIVNRLISIGIEFCGKGSDKLQESMRQQSLSYFRCYHRARLEELKLFLENEQWVVCPIRSNFTVDFLREFRFMRKGMTTPTSPPKVSAIPVKKIDSEQNVFTRYSVSDNPFGEVPEEEDVEDVVMDMRGFEETTSDDEGREDDDVPEELKRSYVDENTGEIPKLISSYGRHRSESVRGPVLANVTLTVVRFIGNYMQMMNVLQPIAYDVLQCLSHLFDYYLYAVYTFFAQDVIAGDESRVLSAKLTTSLVRINDTLLLNQDASVSPEDSLKVPYPVANPFLQLDNAASLYGLSFRVVAIESLVFLAKQFEYLLPHLENLIPETNRNFLTQFFSQTVTPCHELRVPVYTAIATKSLPSDQILQSMSSVKWDIKDIMSQHSHYVDQLLTEFEIYKEFLLAINKQVHIPSESLEVLWDKAILSACQIFVEGFSQAKKCSNEGRALMQLDFQQFRTKLEKLSNIRPLPNHGLVEDYIKAYYLSESDLESWLIQHTEYSTKQLQALVLCGAGGHMNKKTKQRLLALLDNK